MTNKHKLPEIKDVFMQIIEQENELCGSKWPHPTLTAEEAYNTVLQIAEIAQSSTVSRSYNRIYNHDEREFAPESVAGHSNLFQVLYDRFLVYLYGDGFIKTESGYYYREIMEAIRRHDLPENEIGDLPDNGRIYPNKSEQENKYWAEYRNLSPDRYSESERRIEELLYDMRSKETDIGKTLFVADKASAIIHALLCDNNGYPPTMSRHSEYATSKDKYLISTCDALANNGEHYASEMWSVDYFVCRKIAEEDKFGFFTAIIIMFTLMTKGKWYVWRKKQYR